MQQGPVVMEEPHRLLQLPVGCALADESARVGEHHLPGWAGFRIINYTRVLETPATTYITAQLVLQHIAVTTSQT